MAKSNLSRFILMPTAGVSAHTLSSPKVLNFLTGLPHVGAKAAKFALGTKPSLQMTILDSIHEDGAKLVEMTNEAALALRTEQPGLRVVKEVIYRSMVREFSVKQKVKPAAGGVATKIKLRVVSKVGGSPIAGVHVVAFTNFAEREGAEATTNASGEASFNFGASSKKVERLYVLPKLNFWSALKKNTTIASGTLIKLDPVDLAFTGCVRHFYGPGTDDAGKGLKVAVIDCGVDLTHPDLTVVGGENTVVDEEEDDFGDNGDGHGTHVAGIIAARGQAPTGWRGVAPAAELFSYRVFGKNADGASNFAISKAIDRAAAAGCDLINMSLGGGDPDPLTEAAVADARANGCMVIVAAGNDERSPVSFPAAVSQAVAVSAMGRKGTFPSQSSENGDIASPFGTDKKNFVAAFSNVGTAIDVTGPGVGALSTFPGGHAPLSGTSMACPAVCGFAARMLAARSDIMNMARDQARSDAMLQAFFESAKLLGFGPTFEGHGLPQ